MRLIALDTETTGLHSKDGDRIIELALVEISRDPNRRIFHSYFNPQGRPVSPDAFAVHGMSDEFLLDKPLFADKYDEICDILSDATTVIHNAPFDLGFLRDECLEYNLDWPERPVIDTLKLALQERPGKHNSLDALCDWLGIDRTSREKHSALVDTELLAEVYLRWKGQANLQLDRAVARETTHTTSPIAFHTKPFGTNQPANVHPMWDQILAGMKI